MTITATTGSGKEGDSNIDEEFEKAKQPKGAEGLMPQEVAQKNQEVEEAGQEKAVEGQGKGDEDTISVGSELRWTRRCMGGLRRDIGARLAPCYASDWLDAFRNGNCQQSVASVTFLFFACLSPALAFGTIYDDSTEGQIGVMENLIASAVGGIIYPLLCGQPLCILGATGPNLAYRVAFFQLCKSFDIDFLPANLWMGLWCSFFTTICALTDACSLMQYCTRFTEEIFSALISLIFIIEALKANVVAFSDFNNEVALLTCILCFSTYVLALKLKGLKKTTWFNSTIRTTVSNFAVITAIVIVTSVSRLFSEVAFEKLDVPNEFVPTFAIPETNGNIITTEARPWLINPFGGQGLNENGEKRDLPIWVIFFTIVPGIGLTVLNYLDQNLTSLLINRPTSGLKKPVGYHLDMLVLGTIIYPICAFFGLPHPCAATVRSLTHLISVTSYEDQPMPGGGTRRVVAKVIEQRWTNFMIHILLALCLLLSSILKYVPKGVLFGVFLYMGMTSIAGNQLFDRLFLLGMFDPKSYPKYPYVTRIETKRLHSFTIFQFIMLVILYVLKEIKQTGVAFPFFIASLVFVRIGLKKFFTKEELFVLDNHDDLPPDIEKPKPVLTAPSATDLAAGKGSC
jgi:hypothetical protein